MKRKKTTQPKSQIALTAPEPRFLTAMGKLMVGGIFFSALSYDPLENPYLRSGISYVASTIIVSGASDFLDSAMAWISVRLYQDSEDSSTINNQQRNRHRNSPVVMNPKSDLYFKLYKTKQLITCGFYAYGCFTGLFRFSGAVNYVNSENISLFALTYPIELRQPGNSMLWFLEGPFMILPNMGLSALGFFYNMINFANTLKYKHPQPADSPFFQFINAYATMGTTAYLAKKIRTGGTEKLSFPAGTSYETISKAVKAAEQRAQALVPYRCALLYPITFLNQTSAFQAYSGVTTAAKKGSEHFFDQFSIEVTEIAPKPIEKKHTQKKKKSNKKKNILLRDDDNQSDTYEYSGESIVTKRSTPQVRIKENVNKKSTTIAPPSPTTRVKSIAQIKPITQLVDVKYKRNDLQREEKLALIFKLRQCRQVKSRLIERELKQLVTHLPHGANINGITGSEFCLTWSQNNKNYSLKFEKPHGTDSNEYKSSKLKKVLNVIETAYLWGWYPKKVKAHLQQHTRPNLLGRISSILFHRPEVLPCADLNLNQDNSQGFKKS